VEPFIVNLHAMGIYQIADVDPDEITVQSFAFLDDGIAKSLRTHFNDWQASQIASAACSANAVIPLLPKKAPCASAQLVPPMHLPTRTFSRDSGTLKRKRGVANFQLNVSTDETDKEVAKRREAIATLQQAFLEVGQFSVNFEDYADLPMNLQTEYMDNLASVWIEQPASSLNSYISALNTWKEWAISRDISWKTPAAVTFSSFLRAQKIKGPTAAMGIFNRCVWLAKALGMTFPVDSNLCKRISKVPIGHEPEPAIPPKFKVIFALDEIVNSANIFAASIAWFFLLLTVGAIRFEHAQRTAFVALLAWWVVAKAYRGKRREGGIQRSFLYGTPRFSPTGKDLVAAAIRTRDRTIATTDEDDNMSYLLPDFAPERVKISDVTAFSKGPMKASKALQFMRELLSAPRYGIQSDHLEKLTGHSFRHLLPSLAELAQLQPTERLLIGGWKDKSPDVDLLRGVQKRIAMPDLYSHARPLAQARVKIQLVQSMVEAVKATRIKLGRPPDDIVEIEQSWPSKNRSRALVHNFCTGIEATAIRDELPTVTTKPPEPICDASDASSSSSSSSSSSDAPTIDDSDIRDLPWLCTRGQGGKLHLRDQHMGESSTMCGRILARPYDGKGLEEALATSAEWSPRCRRMLPQCACEWWSEAHMVG